MAAMASSASSLLNISQIHNLPGGILTCCINPNGLNNVCKVGSETLMITLQQIQ